MEKDNIIENNNQDIEDAKKWYAIQCMSLHEHKVKKRIEDMIQYEFKNKLFRVLLTEEETVEIKNNARKEKISKIYPGYIFIEMLPDQEIWYTIRRLNGVVRFVGDKNIPSPVEGLEIDKILSKVGEKKVEVDFEINEQVRVINGPFRGYVGYIAEIYGDRGKLKTMIEIFGRETSVELSFEQIEKLAGI